MKIVSAAEMHEIDRVTSADFGVPSLTLMENAGESVALFVISQFPYAKRITVVCGKGNNGGDGFVVARKLQEAGKDVKLALLADPAELKGDAAEMYRQLNLTPLYLRTKEEVTAQLRALREQSDLAIDAILGTGFRPPVSEIYAAAISVLSTFPKVVAVDLPSGADADAMLPIDTSTSVRVDAVVTFTAPRPGHIFGAMTKGPMVIAPIGSPENAIHSNLQLQVITPADLIPAIKQREADSNKGSFGHVLVLGGSFGKAGAAAMSGIAVLRAGAGLSTVGTPKSVVPTVAGFHPEVMTEPLEETETGSISMRALGYGHVDALVKGKTVLAIGPGISRQKETSEFVRNVVTKFDLPMVIDADGLNAFEDHPEKLKKQNQILVLTPHPGEMSRLTGLSIPQIQADRVTIARKFSVEHNVILVLKGHRTLVAEPTGLVWVNTTGNAGMATGGTGDILTGMISGFMAQHPKDTVLAVLAGVYLHGLAGDIARESMGEHSLIATDLLKALPEAFRRARKAVNNPIVEIQN
jgi:ADP-dependent NAD(P)H-hydrate dehydratase / NAD(P)H-hydrate epimerase